MMLRIGLAGLAAAASVGVYGLVGHGPVGAAAAAVVRYAIRHAAG